MLKLHQTTQTWTLSSQLWQNDKNEKNASIYILCIMSTTNQSLKAERFELLPKGSMQGSNHWCCGWCRRWVECRWGAEWWELNPFVVFRSASRCACIVRLGERVLNFLSHVFCVMYLYHSSFICFIYMHVYMHHSVQPPENTPKTTNPTVSINK